MEKISRVIQAAKARTDGSASRVAASAPGGKARQKFENAKAISDGRGIKRGNNKEASWRLQSKTERIEQRSAVPEHSYNQRCPERALNEKLNARR